MSNDGPTRKPRSASQEARDRMGFSQDDLEPAPLPAALEKDAAAFDLLDEYLALDGSRPDRVAALMDSHPELDSRRKVTVALNRARKLWAKERAAQTDEVVAEHYMRIDQMLDSDALEEKIGRADTNSMRLAMDLLREQRAMIGAGADKGKAGGEDVVVNIQMPDWAGRDQVESMAEDYGKVVLDIPPPDPEDPDEAA